MLHSTLKRSCLSLLQTENRGISPKKKNSVSGMGSISPEYASGGNEYLTLAKGLISSLLKVGQIAKVSRILIVTLVSINLKFEVLVR